MIINCKRRLNTNYPERERGLALTAQWDAEDRKELDLREVKV